MVMATVSAPFISVVLVDDHELVRRGTKELLKRDQAVKVVGEAASTRDAMTIICERQPDIAIVDIRLDDGSGLDVIRECQRLGVSTRFMILSAYADDHYVKLLVRMGVRGYLVKTSGGAELKKALHDVADGKLVFPGEVADTVLAVLQSGCSGAEIWNASTKLLCSRLSYGARARGPRPHGRRPEQQRDRHRARHLHQDG